MSAHGETVGKRANSTDETPTGRPQDGGAPPVEPPFQGWEIEDADPGRSRPGLTWGHPVGVEEPLRSQGMLRTMATTLRSLRSLLFNFLCFNRGSCFGPCP